MQSNRVRLAAAFQRTNALNQYQHTDDEAATRPDPQTPLESFTYDADWTLTADSNLTAGRYLSADRNLSADGKLAADGGFAYEWDAENRLMRVWLVDPRPGRVAQGFSHGGHESSSNSRPPQGEQAPRAGCPRSPRSRTGITGGALAVRTSASPLSG